MSADYKNAYDAGFAAGQEAEREALIAVVDRDVSNTHVAAHLVEAIESRGAAPQAEPEAKCGEMSCEECGGSGDCIREQPAPAPAEKEHPDNALVDGLLSKAADELSQEARLMGFFDKPIEPFGNSEQLDLEAIEARCNAATNPGYLMRDITDLVQAMRERDAEIAELRQYQNFGRYWTGRLEQVLDARGLTREIIGEIGPCTPADAPSGFVRAKDFHDRVTEKEAEIARLREQEERWRRAINDRERNELAALAELDEARAEVAALERVAEERRDRAKSAEAEVERLRGEASKWRENHDHLARARHADLAAVERERDTMQLRLEELSEVSADRDIAMRAALARACGLLRAYTRQQLNEDDARAFLAEHGGGK